MKVAISVRLPQSQPAGVDRQAAHSIVHTAEQLCPYSKTVGGKIEVSMGRPSTDKDITDAVMYLTDAVTVTGKVLYVEWRCAFRPLVNVRSSVCLTSTGMPQYLNPI